MFAKFFIEHPVLANVIAFVIMLLGRVPRVGDSVVYKNIRFTVDEMRRHRIVSIRAELLEDAGVRRGGE